MSHIPTLSFPLDWQRQLGARPNGAIIAGVNVTKSGHEFTVTMTTALCGHNLPLFDIKDADIAFGDQSAESNSVVYEEAASGGGPGNSVLINVTRTQEAGDPPGGNVTMQWKGQNVTGTWFVSQNYICDQLPQNQEQVTWCYFEI